MIFLCCNCANKHMLNKASWQRYLRYSSHSVSPTHLSGLGDVLNGTYKLSSTFTVSRSMQREKQVVILAFEVTL